MIDNNNIVICGGIGVIEVRDGIIKVIERIGSFDQHQIASNALAKYDLTIQAKRYIELYTSVINANIS